MYLGFERQKHGTQHYLGVFPGETNYIAGEEIKRLIKTATDGS